MDRVAVSLRWLRRTAGRERLMATIPPIPLVYSPEVPKGRLICYGWLEFLYYVCRLNEN